MAGIVGDRLVPVLDLHRVERHLDHVAVGAELGHRDPVPMRTMSFRRKLNTRDEGEDGVLENEEDDRGECAQAGK